MSCHLDVTYPDRFWWPKLTENARSGRSPVAKGMVPIKNFHASVDLTLSRATVAFNRRAPRARRRQIVIDLLSILVRICQDHWPNRAYRKSVQFATSRPHVEHFSSLSSAADVSRNSAAKAPLHRRRRRRRRRLYVNEKQSIFLRRCIFEARDAKKLRARDRIRPSNHNETDERGVRYVISVVNPLFDSRRLWSQKIDDDLNSPSTCGMNLFLTCNVLGWPDGMRTWRRRARFLSIMFY